MGEKNSHPYQELLDTRMQEKNQTVLILVLLRLLDLGNTYRMCKKLQFYIGFLRMEMELNYFEKTARRTRLAAIFSI